MSKNTEREGETEGERERLHTHTHGIVEFVLYIECYLY